MTLWWEVQGHTGSQWELQHLKQDRAVWIISQVTVQNRCFLIIFKKLFNVFSSWHVASACFFSEYLNMNSQVCQGSVDLPVSWLGLGFRERKRVRTGTGRHRHSVERVDFSDRAINDFPFRTTKTYFAAGMWMRAVKEMTVRSNFTSVSSSTHTQIYIYTHLHRGTTHLVHCHTSCKHSPHRLSASA